MKSINYVFHANTPPGWLMIRTRRGRNSLGGTHTHTHKQYRWKYGSEIFHKCLFPCGLHVSYMSNIQIWKPGIFSQLIPNKSIWKKKENKTKKKEEKLEIILLQTFTNCASWTMHPLNARIVCARLQQIELLSQWYFAVWMAASTIEIIESVMLIVP